MTGLQKQVGEDHFLGVGTEGTRSGQQLELPGDVTHADSFQVRV